MPDATVLHVDAGSDLGARVREALADASGLAVVESDGVEGAAERLREGDVDCVVAQCELPDGSGTELVERAREVSPDVGCVLYGEERPTPSDDTEVGIVEFVPADVTDAHERVADLVGTTALERTQTTYPLPERERERLERVERYDLEGEERPQLQDIVDHAAEHFDVPQATINVVGEDEQRFAVCHDEEWAPVPRQDSICTYSILRDEATVVDDAQVDPRFEGNDVVEELGVRSYAGAPIEPDRELPIATLCVYDEQPDRFDSAEASYLQTLARDAAAVIARAEGEEVDS